MVNVEVQSLLNQVILDYLSVKGLHHTRETLCREIFDSQNVDALNSSQESFLQMWWGIFCDNYNSMFFDFPIVDAEIPNEESIVVNNIDANQSNVSDVMNVTSSPHLEESSPVMKSSDSLDSDSKLLELLVKDSSILQFPNQLNDMDIILPFDERFGTHLEGPNLMEPNMDALTNGLPTSPELLDAAVNSSEDSSILRSLDQLNDMDVILSFADAGYGTNLEGPTLMESNMHAPTNVLPTSPDFLDAAINSSQDSSFLRSLDQLNEMDLIREFARNVGYGTNWEGPKLMEPNVHAPTNALPTSSEILDAAVNASQDSSILVSLDQFNETDFILPFSRNDGYGTNLEGPTLMEPNVHAPTNALPTSLEFLDAAVNSSEDSSILRSLDQLNDMDVIRAFARNAEYETNLEGPALIEPNMNIPANALPTSPVFLDADVDSSQESSFLRSLNQLNDMDVIHEFARNVGYGTNREGHTPMEPNVHAPTNALPTSSEFLDAAICPKKSKEEAFIRKARAFRLSQGNNRSLQPASPQDWTSNALPDELDKYYDNQLKLTLTKYKTSLKNRSQGESSEKSARVFTDHINQRASSGKLLADQSMIAPTRRIMRSYEKQPVVQSGKKRKLSLNSLASVEKEKGIVIIDLEKDNTQIEAQSDSMYASTQRANKKGNNRALQASHQELPWNVLPDETDEYYANKLKLTLTNYKNSLKSRTQGESSEKNAQVCTDINQGASGNLLAGKHMIAPTGRIMRSNQKQPVVQSGRVS